MEYNVNLLFLLRFLSKAQLRSHLTVILAWLQDDAGRQAVWEDKDSVMKPTDRDMRGIYIIIPKLVKEYLQRIPLHCGPGWQEWSVTTGVAV